MANGDAASAAGMDVVPGTADRRLGYDEINKTRDYIAQRTSTVTPLSKGGTGATTAAAARTALDVPSKADLTNGIGSRQPAGSYAGRDYNGRVSFDWSSGLKVTVDQTQMDIPTSAAPNGFARTSDLGGVVRQGQSFDAQGGYIASMGSRNATVTSNFASLYADGSTGLFGIPGSSRRFKKDLTEWTADQARKFLSLVNAYHGHYTADDADDPLRPFFILEEFQAAGFGQFVIYGAPQVIDGDGNPVVDEAGVPVYDPDAEPVGIGLHYELVTVALLAVLKDHEARLSRIEEYLTDHMEADNA